MKGIDLTRRLAVEAPVRSRDDEQAVGSEHACDLGKHPLLVGKMLDDLERDHRVK